MHFKEFSIKCTKMQTNPTPFQKGLLPNTCVCHPTRILQSPSTSSPSPERLNSLLPSDTSHCAHYPSPLAIMHFAPVLRLSQTRSAQSLLSGTAWGKAVTPAETQQAFPWLLVLHSKFILFLTLLLLTETGVTFPFCLHSSPYKKPTPTLPKTIHSEEISADSSVRLQITQKMCGGAATSLPSPSKYPRSSPSSFALPI